MFTINCIDYSKIIIQIPLAIIKLIDTAAEPKSFARPDKGWISKPTRSTTASIAVLIISAKITNKIASIKITCSFPLILNKNDRGIAKSNSITSCRKADSFWYNHVNARNEFSIAKYILCRPLGLLLLSNTDIYPPFLMV